MDERPDIDSDPAPGQTIDAAKRRRLLAFMAAVSVALTLLTAAGVWLVSARNEPAPLLRAEELLRAPEPEKRVGAEISSVLGEVVTKTLAIPAKVESDPRFAFLLLGYGGAGHEGAYLTDSIVVAIADPSLRTLTLLSIPRDSWAPLLFDGKTPVYNKLNTAYALAKYPALYPNRLARYTGSNGAGSMASDTISRLLGIPIANYLALDFEGFRNMVNAVGGIDVEVPASFTALYPASDDPSLDPSWTTVRFTKGLEHMNGERAIRFVRAREVLDNPSEGMDFARSRRQRLTIEAFKARLFAPGGLIQLPQLLGIAARHVDTDYALPDVAKFREIVTDWKDVKIYQTALTAGNYLAEGTGPAGTYVLVPRTSDRSWSQVRAFVRRLWRDPATGVAMAGTRVVVVNNTGKSGAGTRLSEALAGLGYRVGEPTTGPLRAQSRLIDRTGGKAEAVIAQLAKDLGRPLPVLAPAGAAVSDDLVLELGADDLALADLVVPTDNAAPSSATGVLSGGGWSPPLPLAGPAASATPTLSPTAVLKPTRTVSAAGTPTVQPTPSATPIALPTLSPTPVPTRTPVPPKKATGTPTPQFTPTPSATPTTPLPSPTSTSTAVPPSPTSTPTAAPPSPSPTLTPPSPTPTLAPPSPTPTKTTGKPKRNNALAAPSPTP